MQFGYTILYVNDVEATIEFYKKAFGFAERFIMQGQYGEIETGNTRLAFSQTEFAKTLTSVEIEAARLDRPAPPVELGMCTEDVDADFKRALEAGAIEVSKPEVKPWGQTVGIVRDPNGFLIEICTPMP